MRVLKEETEGPCQVIISASGPRRCGMPTPFTTQINGETYRICVPHVESQRKIENEAGGSRV